MKTNQQIDQLKLISANFLQKLDNYLENETYQIFQYVVKINILIHITATRL